MLRRRRLEPLTLPHLASPPSPRRPSRHVHWGRRRGGRNVRVQRRLPRDADLRRRQLGHVAVRRCVRCVCRGEGREEGGGGFTWHRIGSVPSCPLHHSTTAPHTRSLHRADGLPDLHAGQVFCRPADHARVCGVGRRLLHLWHRHSYRCEPALAPPPRTAPHSPALARCPALALNSTIAHPSPSTVCTEQTGCHTTTTDKCSVDLPTKLECTQASDGYAITGTDTVIGASGWRV